jgi:cysteine desulfurase/selenocysteine lyase
MIYLDNAATSFPKPAECFRRALELFLIKGASPGRGGYDLAVEAEGMVLDVRRRLAAFFGADDFWPTCFSYNATEALNTLIQGLARPGGHVVSTRLEHNSVLRPLHHLATDGVIDLDLVPFDGQGLIDPDRIAAAIRPQTNFVVITHASNVLGTIQPAAAVGRICRERGVPLLLDVSQSAGATPIRMKDWDVAGLAFTGHKSLLGPTGIGGLVIRPDLDVKPSRFGGTGVDSSRVWQDEAYPSRLEAGTLNLLGILTLDACLDFLESDEAAAARRREMVLFQRLWDGLSEMTGVQVYGAGPEVDCLPVLSCNVAGRRAEDVGLILDGDFEIAVRTGLHCAPLAHQDLGTGESGSVRFSPGPFNTEADIEAALEARRLISKTADR